AGIPAHVDDQRGFDHGLFIPLNLMYPQADIPALQLSLQSGLAPDAHIAIGEALRDLQADKLLVIGSGFSFHNMSAFFHHDPDIIASRNNAFQDWLIDVVTADIDQQERKALLVNWKQAPHARYCHPREEHLLPLHVCLGMAGRAGELIFDDQIMGVRCMAFMW
ncbi:MAG TPA: class III extradiol ring-cleavage dioxygenase, partial [Brevefilum fermentans]|nr:class III extradiol ring-cleavage dioxygenase [Brevefilum fermentans]